MKRRILLYTADFSPMAGGISVFLQNICLQLIKQNYLVEVLVLDKKKIDAEFFDKTQPYKITRFSTTSYLSSLFPIVQLFKAIRRFKPDILFLGHVMSTFGFGAVLAKKLFNIPNFNF